ncbi:unnamed protein product [marine sediment metagenome]|uniref:Uncharacterized protein n=1 Tax=marine sediment metagenome TaxID=412755 RepID=X0RL37_9ZZZZ
MTFHKIRDKIRRIIARSRDGRARVEGYPITADLTGIYSIGEFYDWANLSVEHRKEAYNWEWVPNMPKSALYMLAEAADA